MAFEGLADKLGNAFKKLKNKGKLSEKDVKEAMREVRLALLEADVTTRLQRTYKQSNRACCRSGCYAKSYSCTDGC